MKNFTKKDIFYLWVIALSFLGIVFYISTTMRYYGSQLDWYGQHVPIAEYIRTLFYSTHDLFPDFAFNIGSGQNIYNFSYYGLLSPILIISYFFPKVKMVNYLITATILTVIISAVLLYGFLRNKKISSEACFLSVLIFVLSSPISLHSHRHIMFITYMPFLIMGLYGVEKKVNEGKGWLLALSVFLTVMTSYYYSISGIISLIVYAIYCYLKKMNNVTLKDFTKFIFNLSIPFIIGVLSSCIITLPTMATILHNRAESNVSISLKDLLLPNLKLNNLLYGSYGLGLNAIAIPALINFFKNKKERIFLGTTLSLLVIFNIFNYILNGTMYIDAKSLIPFLPLYILTIATLLNDALEKKINYKLVILITLVVVLFVVFAKYKEMIILIDIIVVLLSIILYKFTNKKVLLVLPIMIFTIISSAATNKEDNLVPKLTAEDDYNKLKEQIDMITEGDNEYYRISNDYDITDTPNTNYENINYLNATTYSSISNQTYNKFYFDILNNNMPARNRALTVATQNIMSLHLMSNKYVISRNKALQGYEQINVKDGINVYKNENVLPLGYASSNILSYEDFEKLSNPEKQEALLNNIIADSKTSNNYVTNVKKIDLNFKEILQDPNITEDSDGTFTVRVKDTLKINYTLPSEYQNKIIFIRFKMNNIEYNHDLTIIINNVKNKLTAASWKYYNGNEVFDFVLAEKDLTKLTMKFDEGTFNIGDFETYILDYADIENISNNVDKFNIDRLNTKGDKIVGNINVKEDGYFLIQIPFDNGFTIKVDGEKTKVEKLDDAYIGCKITSGVHDIEIEYNAPLKKLSVVISSFGIIIFIAVTYLESKKKI